jgi:hypothetical protein
VEEGISEIKVAHHRGGTCAGWMITNKLSRMDTLAAPVPLPSSLMFEVPICNRKKTKIGPQATVSCNRTGTSGQDKS